MPTLTELTTPLTRAEILERLRTRALERGLPMATWYADDDPRAMLEIQALQTADVWSLVPLLASLRALETSEGIFLDFVAYWDYGTARNAATRTVRSVTLRCSPDTGPYTISDNQLWATSNKGDRFNSEAGGFLASGATLTVLFHAEFAGESTRFGQITELNTPLPGVTIDAQSISVVGTDAESDSSLRARAKGKQAGRGIGKPQGVYSTTITETDESITRVRIDQPRGAGTLDAVFTTNTGIVPAPLLALVQSRIENVRSLTADVATYPASNVNATISATLKVQREFRSTAEIAAPSALEQLENVHPIGESIPAALVTAALMSVRGMVDVTYSAFNGVTLQRNQIATLVLNPTWIEV